eukprot:1160637-Pelagomonas_calceolata.AAC.1
MPQLVPPAPWCYRKQPKLEKCQFGHTCAGSMQKAGKCMPQLSTSGIVFVNAPHAQPAGVLN